MHRNLDTKLLRAYLAIVETGGFTNASQKLHLTQSAVSNQLKRLEGQLETRLIERRGKVGHLTEEGRMLLAFARRMIKLNDEAVATFLKPEISGVVRIGIVEEVASGPFSDALASYNRRHRSVQIELTIGLTRYLLEQLNRGDLDLVVGKRRAQSQDDGHVLYRDKLRWVAHRQFAFEGAGQLPLVLSPAPCIHREAMINALEASQRNWRVVCHAPTLTSVKAAVMARIGISALDSRTMEPAMYVLDGDQGFPELPDNEIVLFANEELGHAAQDLSSALQSNFADQHISL